MSGDPFGLALDRIRAILGDGTALALSAEDHLAIARAQLETALYAARDSDTAAALAFAEEAVVHLRKAAGHRWDAVELSPGWTVRDEMRAKNRDR